MSKSISTRLGQRLVLAAVSLNQILGGVISEAMALGQGPRADFAEVCCSPQSRLTEGLKEKGFRTSRINLEQGFDLNNKEDCRRARCWFEQHRPRKTWISTMCKYFSQMQNCTPEWKRDPSKWDNFLRARLRARHLNGHVVDTGNGLSGVRAGRRPN